jgi:hypothetical protein
VETQRLRALDLSWNKESWGRKGKKEGAGDVEGKAHHGET